jgi:hypothetical protein
MLHTLIGSFLLFGYFSLGRFIVHEINQCAGWQQEEIERDEYQNINEALTIN